ncbi:RNA-binding protein, putative [Entamoeba invadens IP1]|uniref:RNA-binding protein, putative n=1 Tax=Entamoeba invadens IP1 TaxID=370355 RepID=L7FK04_ENTIV|nr:RNA-binding protein, putative [Entamoeba invadens IP1]ELP84885.1 RNA-binding protein, putative [Entamoeba invadens IP1]|eukprot:XP_004184231.1 RNA-binding protein, putative [Entamoeba invadens IP1]
MSERKKSERSRSRSRSRSESRGATKDEKERPSRTLFAHNISYNVPETEIKELFSKYGELKKVFSKIDDRGIAFITYYDIRAAEKAHNDLDNLKLNGRTIKVHYSLPKGNEINQPEVIENHANLYVMFKSCTVRPSRGEAFEFFSQFGEVTEVRDSSDPTVKFVEYYDSRHSARALKESKGMSFKGGVIEIRYASFSKKDVERIEQSRERIKGLRDDGKDRSKTDRETSSRERDSVRERESNEPKRLIIPPHLLQGPVLYQGYSYYTQQQYEYNPSQIPQQPQQYPPYRDDTNKNSFGYPQISQQPNSSTQSYNSPYGANSYQYYQPVQQFPGPQAQTMPPTQKDKSPY